MVWLEFEGGNIDVPIWSGCFWEKSEDNPAKDLLKEPKDAAETIMFKTHGYSFYISKDGDAKGMQIKIAEPVAKYPFMIDIKENKISLTTDVENKNEEQALSIDLQLKDEQSISISNGKKQTMFMQKEGISLTHEDSEKAVAKLSKEGISRDYKKGSIKLEDNAGSWKQASAKIDLKNNKIHLNKDGLEVS